jgi:hypothetical protein
MLVPQAHAAHLTALKVLSVGSSSAGYSVRIVTAGNDQRIKLWQLDVKIESLLSLGDVDLTYVSLQKVEDVWTAVADISALEVVQLPIQQHEDKRVHHSDSGIIVVGVGMQLLRF